MCSKIPSKILRLNDICSIIIEGLKFSIVPLMCPPEGITPCMHVLLEVKLNISSLLVCEGVGVLCEHFRYPSNTSIPTIYSTKFSGVRRRFCATTTAFLSTYSVQNRCELLNSASLFWMYRYIFGILCSASPLLVLSLD